MPADKDRIEHLQDQSKGNCKNHNSGYAAAEILVMRNMIKDERGNKKGLTRYKALNEEAKLKRKSNSSIS